MKLFDAAKIIRSKNAGPLFITFDLMFEDRAAMEAVLLKLTPQMVAAVYGVDAESVSIIPYEVVDAIKITFPRKHVSGALEEDDVYGCQQHMPLARIEL